jgi:hypothetical protein
LKKAATADPIVPFAGILGKLPLKVGEEIRAAGPLVETFPETRAATFDLKLRRKGTQFHLV